MCPPERQQKLRKGARQWSNRCSGLRRPIHASALDPPPPSRIVSRLPGIERLRIFATECPSLPAEAGLRRSSPQRSRALGDAAKGGGGPLLPSADCLLNARVLICSYESLRPAEPTGVVSTGLLCRLLHAISYRTPAHWSRSRCARSLRSVDGYARSGFPVEAVIELGGRRIAA